MKVAFYVRPSRDKGYLINLRVTLGVGEQYRFSTGQKVNDIKNWTGENVKRSRSEPNALQTNHYLSKLKNYLNASLYDLSLIHI